MCIASSTSCLLFRGVQDDFNGVDFGTNATRGAQVLSMQAIAGTTPDAGSNGVYAWFTGEGGDVELSQGYNYVQMLHPNRKESRTVAAFTGVFMYRIHDARAAQSTNTLRVGQSTLGLLPKLVVGQETVVEHLALPGQSLQLQVEHEFATAAYALQGFEYTVKYTGNAVGSLLPNNLQLSLPVGYSAYADANLTFAPAPSPLIANGVHSLYLNATATGNFTAAGGVQQTSFGSDATTVHARWQVPLDVASSSVGAANFAALVIPGPNMLQRSGVAVGYDWSVQTSPFADVVVTVNSITPYPMLSELSNLHLRNWDTDESKGHSVASPTEQEPFAIFRVRIDSPMWLRMRVHFNDVKDMNVPAGVAAGSELPPACQPLWEVQIARDLRFSTPGSSGPSATASGRRANGFGVAWAGPASPTTPTYYNWENAFDGSSQRADAQAALLNTRWASADGALAASVQAGAHVARAATTRPLWMLVRVAALPRGYAVSTARPDVCSSNNIRIGSATLQLDSVADECSSSLDCTVEADGHPAEERKEDSANGDAARFTRCALQITTNEDGRRVPAAKCMECTGDSHCQAGQYCHLDDGLCSLGSASPDSRFTRWYNCDSTSAALFGVCREKSSDVLGKTCVSHMQSATSLTTPAMVHPILGSSSTAAPGGQLAVRGAGSVVPAANRFDPVGANPSNNDFGEGSGGICGEFRFINTSGIATDAFGRSTGPDSSLSQAGLVRVALWTGFCDANRVCQECVPGAGQNGVGANAGSICLNGRMFSAQDVDGTNRSYTSNTLAGTQLGTTFMVILLIVLFVVYMYGQSREFRHAHGLPALSWWEVALCCGVCARLGPAAPAPAAAKPAPTTAAAAVGAEAPGGEKVTVAQDFNTEATETPAVLAAGGSGEEAAAPAAAAQA